MPPVSTSPPPPYPPYTQIATQHARTHASLKTRQLTSLSSLPQRHQTLPPAQTSSARAALQSFYCDLCSKGYSRMNDYEAHLSSYDHSHRQRMKDMKQMVKDPTAGARARRAEAKADGLISIKLGGGGVDASAGAANDGGGGGGGFKKSGFKKSGFKSAFAPVGGGAGAGSEDVEMKMKMETKAKAPVPVIPGREHLALDIESDTDDEGYEVYNPRFPTD
ncbi:hypothetical protein F4808DRAFT_321427 [Astrocystis sublimbata]|nr:hypothetical protein F4808DRAFT_321427 [Astrocystis sublimbata]